MCLYCACAVDYCYIYLNRKLVVICIQSLNKMLRLLKISHISITFIRKKIISFLSRNLMNNKINLISIIFCWLISASSIQKQVCSMYFYYMTLVLNENFKTRMQSISILFKKVILTVKNVAECLVRLFYGYSCGLVNTEFCVRKYCPESLIFVREYAIFPLIHYSSKSANISQKPGCYGYF